MAGIGFVLRKLARRDDILGVLESFAHSSLASAGPWVFTVASLTAVFGLSLGLTNYDQLYSFRLTVTYNFSFSLVFSGPVVMLATRCLADRIYERNVEGAPGMMLGAMLVLFIFELPLALYFYLFHFDLTPVERLAGLFNFYLISGIWLIGIFLTTLKNYKAVSGAFAMGMLAAVAGAVAFSSQGSAGMLMGYNLGLAWILFAMVSRVLAEYPFPALRPFEFLSYLKEYRYIALSGLVYNLGIWIDKWIMWTAPEAERLPTGMVSYPHYDSSVFLAYLSIIPSIAIFVMSVETAFFERYLSFYRAIQRHGTWAEIVRRKDEIAAELKDSGRKFLIIQGCISALVLLAAPVFFVWIKASFTQLGIFRLGLLGAFFHSFFLFMSILLAYFDLRKVTLYLQLLFLVLNGGLTYLCLWLGFPFYGVGYCLACLISSVAAMVTLAYYVDQLPYQTFVGGNRTLRY